MERTKINQKQRQRRCWRVTNRIKANSTRPRLAVFRSLKNISAQIIDDKTGTTLAHASSLEKDIASELNYGGNVAAAAKVGQILAERALANGVNCATLDRRHYRYHGRVAALADAARAAGLDLGGKADSAE
ncbi:MAG: 50S ribosomal protein L18 [Planctomycetaceae bacterium]|nr:50S ribosomal protein L18 [Planctomycetaceae bacterium]MBQ2822296.1 50S ribosomal protein L18 [Thermoguttaceae bacterium]MDO4424562.1 50S ribosomal protein L18 [Planctomycetia bacterium]